MDITKFLLFIDENKDILVCSLSMITCFLGVRVQMENDRLKAELAELRPEPKGGDGE